VADFEQRLERGAEEAVGAFLLTLLTTRAIRNLELRREDRGRARGVFRPTMRLLTLLLEIPVVIWALHIVAGPTISEFATVFMFLFFCLIGLALNVMLLAPLLAIVLYGSIELYDMVRGTHIPRPGHWLTLDEVYQDAEYVQRRLHGQNHRALSRGALAIFGAGLPLGVELGARDQTIRQMDKLRYQEQHILAGGQIWVND
jgi:hypothetical protein